MKEIVIKTYNINELKTINEKAYKKVLERYTQFLIEDRFSFASEDIITTLYNKYKLDIDEKNIDYSISYCQGDGFCFTEKNILSYTRLKNKENLNVFEKWIINNLSDTEIKMLLDYLNSGYNLEIKKTSYHYSHPHTCMIDYEYFYSSDDEKYIESMNNFIDELTRKLFNSVYVVICEEIEDMLYKYYDVDDDDVINNLDINEYYFDVNGNLY